MRTTLIHFFTPLFVLFNIPLLFDPRFATYDVAPRGCVLKTAYRSFPGLNLVMRCGRRHNKDPAKVK